MEAKKNSNLPKAVAFFLIVSVLIGAIAFSASGWQGDTLNKPDSNDTDSGGNSTNGNVDENTDGGSGENEDTTPPKPLFFHYITGLEITEEDSYKKPYAVVIDSSAPIYGLSSAFMTVEVPIENGKTRLVAFTNDASRLGKLGSIAPTRNYISNIAGYFGGVLLSLGNDDSFSYPSYEPTSGEIDLSKYTGYHYSEYGIYNYTNADLIGAYIKNNNVGTVMITKPNMPYQFAESGISGGASATSVLLALDRESTTELSYSSLDSKYILKKNGVAVTDKLNDKALAYDNVFILYADATTYETAEKTQMILDTQSGGAGYYVNGGLSIPITWSTMENGEIGFYLEDGSKLSVGCGSSYIAIAKSSQISSTKIS